YLGQGQPQGDAPQQEEVAVGPVDQLVDAAVGVDEGTGLQVAPGLHPVATHGSVGWRNPNPERTQTPKWDGEPKPQRWDGEPKPQRWDGEPKPQTWDGEPKPQRWDGEIKPRVWDGGTQTQSVGWRNPNPKAHPFPVPREAGVGLRSRLETSRIPSRKCPNRAIRAPENPAAWRNC
uniref:Uncharacterized protein n=1 Tax=Cyanistes caeruleus TaxID=156563 RepID=A0A8C0ZAJ8_CYACU